MKMERITTAAGAAVATTSTIANNEQMTMTLGPSRIPIPLWQKG